MNFARLAFCALIFAPCVAGAATNDFTMAARLLAAAKGGNTYQVQMLVNNGANINYVDATGMSLVCTAIMNNDLRAAQILQMYGADASQCDRQIKNYRGRNSSGQSEGIWGGLSQAQSLTLTALGAGAVVAGLFLLTDIFDYDNDNPISGGGSGGGGSGGGGSDVPDTGTPIFGLSGLPYGPAMPSALAESTNYVTNLGIYYLENVVDPETGQEVPNTQNYENFQYMTNSDVSNYLLLMRGYSPLARGYLGMRTLRNASTYTPLTDFKNYFLGTTPVAGGRPVNVALVTANGIDAATNTSLVDVLTPWTTVSGDNTSGGASQYMISSKYYNNVISLGENNNDIADDTASEDASLLSVFDLSNSGTAIHNSMLGGITEANLPAQIVGGYTGGYDHADFVGFMPNGQMTIYRTGGGNVMVVLDTPVAAGTCTGNTILNGDTVGLFDKTLNATVNGNAVSLTDGTDTYNGYIGADGLLYMDSDGDGYVDMGYTLSDGLITQTKELQTSDYKNFAALNDALTERNLDLNYPDTTPDNLGRSKVDVIANIDVIEPLHSASAPTLIDMSANNFSADVFSTFIGNTYGTTTATEDAQNFFNDLSSATAPALVVFSTGASEYTKIPGVTPPVAQATFENSAPLVFDNLEHKFMSVVAVWASTLGADTIAPNSASMPVADNLYSLADWSVGSQNYQARVCGIAGQGGNGIDPWCFSAVGVTDEMATAAAAGAAGALRSAFYYMTPEQIFMLLALTADGPYLGRLTAISVNPTLNSPITPAQLVEHLKLMYIMPNGYDSNDVNTYLANFKQIYGYGVINLERATTPGTNIYVYDGNNIISSPSNAYWRAAANTGLRSSGALNFGNGAINISAYDILESIDGSMQLPRIWNNEIRLGGNGRHALYMGDVLGDLKIRDTDHTTQTIGNFSFSLAQSKRAYDDGMGGLDTMRFGYKNGNWNLTGDYQHYLTDGESRFRGMANPILALASNAVTGGAEYNYGKWSFGARAFSGAITDEGLLENDPAISSNYEPMRLGMVDGVVSNIGWKNDRFGINTSVGMMRENNTVMGAMASGLLELAGTDTTFVDADAFWKLSDSVRVRARATFAHSVPNMEIDSGFGLSALDSNAFAFGVNVGRFDFGVSMPLAVHRGEMNYAYADYGIIESDDGRYDIAVTDFGTRLLDLKPVAREVRLNATYRHHFGEFTDGVFGFIYRIHPNNTDEFGNESLFMLKLSHMVGI